MHVTPLDLACPLDGLPFGFSGSSALCANGHSFDRAREGYFNLLTSQHKSSSDPGDMKAMLDARHRVLGRGAYAPLAAGLFTEVEALSQGSNRFRIVDAGCGEGYYLDSLAQEARHSTTTAEWQLAGFDISKWGIRHAARRSSSISWAVANNRYPPCPPRSVDLILCMFGFPIWNAFASVQPAGGHVLLVDPGADHLIELRSLIYETVRRHDVSALGDAFSQGYNLEATRELRFPIRLETPGEIADLLAMTPHSFRVSPNKRAAVEALPRMDVTAHILFRVLRLKE